MWSADIKAFSSVLISGGYNEKGEIPWKESLSFLKELRKKGYRINLHLGTCEKAEVSLLKEISPVISFDFITDDEMLEMAGFSVRKKDFLSTFSLLLKENFPIFPHLLLGRNRGKIKQEYQALRILASYSPEKLVFLVYLPPPVCSFSPPSLFELERFWGKAREILPGTNFYLGCLRPRGIFGEKIEELALKYQFQKVVMPSRRIKTLAEEQSFLLKEEWECCVFDSDIGGNCRSSGT